MTLDTGALIALEALATRAVDNRTAHRLAQVLARPTTDPSTRVRATAPAVVIAEWWRGQRGPAAGLLDRRRIEVQPVTREIAERAGQVLAAIGRKSRAAREGLLLVDAIVVLTAAERGDVVYTSDVADLEQVRDAGNFQVKILGI